MVVCPHFLAPDPPIRYRPISTIVDATGVFLGLAFGPSIRIFGRWPRCQCETFHWGYLPPPFKSNNRVILHTDSFLCSGTCARREGTTGSPSPRAHGIFRTPERLSLVQYNGRWEPPQSVFSLHGPSRDLGPVDSKWLLRMVPPITATVPDLRSSAESVRSYLPVLRCVLEKLEQTNTRALSFLAINPLRRNRRSAGDGSNRGSDKGIIGPHI